MCYTGNHGGLVKVRTALGFRAALWLHQHWRFGQDLALCLVYSCISHFFFCKQFVIFRLICLSLSGKGLESLASSFSACLLNAGLPVKWIIFFLFLQSVSVLGGAQVEGLPPGQPIQETARSSYLSSELEGVANWQKMPHTLHLPVSCICPSTPPAAHSAASFGTLIFLLLFSR